jgi:hypothetical protein
LQSHGLKLKEGEQFAEKLLNLRLQYEPYATAIGRKLILSVPPWIHEGKKRKDNWQGGPWDVAIQARGLAGLASPRAKAAHPSDDHF